VHQESETCGGAYVALSEATLAPATICRPVQRFRQVWPDEPHHLHADDEKVLKRLSSDNRMQDAWKLLAKLPEESVYSFIEDVLIAKSDSEIVPHARAHHRRLLKNIAIAHKATETLKQTLRQTMADVMVSRSIFVRAVRRYEEYLRTPLEHLHRTPLDRPEDVLKSLLCINAYLGICALRARTELAEISRHVSRKASSGERTEFIRELAKTIKRLFGKPHYEMVAAITSVVFSAGGDISADAVRKADRRRNPDDSQAYKEAE
jgi:hypothetical protein